MNIPIKWLAPECLNHKNTHSPRMFGVSGAFEDLGEEEEDDEGEDDEGEEEENKLSM